MEKHFRHGSLYQVLAQKGKAVEVQIRHQREDEWLEDLGVEREMGEARRAPALVGGMKKMVDWIPELATGKMRKHGVHS